MFLRALLLAIIASLLIPTFAFCQSAKDAFKSLKKLEARTDTGVSYRDYPQVLADAKVEVESFLNGKEAKKNPQLASFMEKALKYYLIAGDIWKIKFIMGRPNDIINADSPEGRLIGKLYPKAKAETPKAPAGVFTTPDFDKFQSKRGPVYFIPEILSNIWADASKEIKKASEYVK